MVTLTSIIETIDWEMGKSDLRNAFAYMDTLPPHPSQNAIGFATEIDGIPSAVICYFQKKLFKEKLGAINVMVYDEPPDPSDLMETYEKAVDELSQEYGQPRIAHEGYSVWVSRGRVIAMGTQTGILGLRLGDPKIDTPSAIAIGIEGRKENAHAKDSVSNPIGLMIKTLYIDNYKALYQSYKEFSVKYNLTLTKEIEFELLSFLYCTFDMSIASGPKKEIREKIRDKFIMALDYPQNVINRMSDRAMEYATAFNKEKDPKERPLKIFIEFAKHVNYDYSFVLIPWAATWFYSSFKVISDFVDKIIESKDEISKDVL